MKRFFNYLFICTLVLSPYHIGMAQESPEVTEATQVTEAKQSRTPLQCSDWYRFGSVTATFATAAEPVLPGATLSFSGTLENTNPYPLVGGTLTARVFHISDESFSAGFGNDVVDEFVIAKDVSLGAQMSVPQTFTWQVPRTAQGGQYYVAYFYATKEGYHLMGLPYSDFK
jgi:hypothetical protein